MVVAGAGFTFVARRDGGFAAAWDVVLACVLATMFLLLLLSVVGPAAAILMSTTREARRLKEARKRERVLRLGLCPICDYDLRVTPDSCPECGWVRVQRP